MNIDTKYKIIKDVEIQCYGIKDNNIGRIIYYDSIGHLIVNNLFNSPNLDPSLFLPRLLDLLEKIKSIIEEENFIISKEGCVKQKNPIIKSYYERIEDEFFKGDSATCNLWMSILCDRGFLGYRNYPIDYFWLGEGPAQQITLTAEELIEDLREICEKKLWELDDEKTSLATDEIVLSALSPFGEFPMIDTGGLTIREALWGVVLK